MKFSISKTRIAVPASIAALLSGAIALVDWAKTPPVYYEVSMLAPQRSGTAQLFFDIGHGFVEADSVRATVIGGYLPNVYRFPLPASVSGVLRIDPVDRVIAT